MRRLSLLLGLGLAALPPDLGVLPPALLGIDAGRRSGKRRRSRYEVRGW